jgi:hypothetical protein
VDVATFSDQVDNGPVIFSLLKMIHTEVDEFGSRQSATKQDRQHCMVALPSDPFDIWCVQGRLGLFCGEPIFESDAHLFCSFDPTNTIRQLGAEESRVGCFVCETANSSHAQVNRGRGQLATLEFQSVSEDYCLTESESGLGAVPCDEIIDGESIGPARI